MHVRRRNGPKGLRNLFIIYGKLFKITLIKKKAWSLPIENLFLKKNITL